MTTRPLLAFRPLTPNRNLDHPRPRPHSPRQASLSGPTRLASLLPRPADAYSLPGSSRPVIPAAGRHLSTPPPAPAPPLQKRTCRQRRRDQSRAKTTSEGDPARGGLQVGTPPVPRPTRRNATHPSAQKRMRRLKTRRTQNVSSTLPPITLTRLTRVRERRVGGVTGSGAPRGETGADWFVDTALSHVPCKFFRQGACTAGPACVFSHDLTIPGTVRRHRLSHHPRLLRAHSLLFGHLEQASMPVVRQGAVQVRSQGPSGFAGLPSVYLSSPPHSAVRPRPHPPRPAYEHGSQEQEGCPGCAARGPPVRPRHQSQRVIVRPAFHLPTPDTASPAAAAATATAERDCKEPQELGGSRSPRASPVCRTTRGEQLDQATRRSSRNR